jgi:amidase
MMIRTVSACFVVLAIFPGSTLTGQTLAQSDATVTGRWVLAADYYGSTRYLRLQLDSRDGHLTGAFNGDPLEGTLAGTHLHFLAKNNNGSTSEVDASVQQNAMSGTVVQCSPTDPSVTFHFSATLVRILQRGVPQRHEFTPTTFAHEFSPFNAPVLTVAPGDTIHTTTVDAGGNDEHSVKRTAGGNPQTGPFFIAGAMPGDTLVVHLTRVRLNRDWAGSDDSIVESGLNSRLAVRMKDTGKSIRWHLDLASGVASPEASGEHLASFKVPVRPMLGCIAVASGPAAAPPPTGDSGAWGGNIDFNEVGEGATIYLPVNNPGALLYVGDGHALQGDGEINGNALETSMDVEFTVDVIQAVRVPSARVETPSAIIAMGLQGSLDDAFRDATLNMAQWLADDYKLTPSEVAQVIGVTAEYRISEVADRNSGVVLKIDKSKLATLSVGR